MGQLDKQLLTATRKVRVWINNYHFVVATVCQCVYSFSKSTKGVLNVQGAWYFSNTAPTIFHGQDFHIIT